MKRYFTNLCLLGLQVSVLTLSASRAFADPTIRQGGMYRPRPTPPPHPVGTVSGVRRSEGSESVRPETVSQGLNMGPQNGDRLELSQGRAGPPPPLQFGCAQAITKVAGYSALAGFGAFVLHETLDAFGSKTKLAAGVSDLLHKQGLPAQGRSVLGNIRDEKGAFIIHNNTTGQEYSLPKEKLARMMAGISFNSADVDLDTFARDAAARNRPELLAGMLMALQRDGHVLNFHVLEGGGWKPVTGQVEYDAGKYEVRVRSLDEPQLLPKKYPLSSVSFSIPQED